jgi:hypothetical protein
MNGNDAVNVVWWRPHVDSRWQEAWLPGGPPA